MLYQLSYASPSHPGNTLKTKFNGPKSIPKTRTDTLPLRTFNGTEIKVSTPPPWEQTRLNGRMRAGIRVTHPFAAQIASN
jgi:hypothetical protein